MKPNQTTPCHHVAHLVRCAFAVGGAWILSLASYGQDAAALTAPAGKGEGEERPAQAKERKVDAPPPKPVDDTPSRFAGNDTSAYTLSRFAVFSMRQRETDPFGLNQDPNVKPPEKRTTTKAPVKRLAALPPTPLADIVRLIRVTTIMPSEKKFLVGVREFSESDEFPLVFQGKRMRMKVIEVSASRIVFRNLDNGDTAPLTTGMLPPGMVAGAESIKPAGMVSPVDDVPLELGAETPENPETNEESTN